MEKIDDFPINRPKKFPPWLHKKLSKKESSTCSSEIHKQSLHTVCEEAKCPNRNECYAKKTATFLALGKLCTRSCGFCAVDFSKSPPPPDPDEPQKIVEAISKLDIAHAVITQVTRDDLEDGGAQHMANILRAIQMQTPQVTTEVLTSDFNGNEQALHTVLEALPTIFSHNIETVERLSNSIRHKASFSRSLTVLKNAKSSQRARFIKSGIMLGLGETKDEIIAALQALAAVGCDIVTIGQYLQPHRKKLAPCSFISPEEFEEYATLGRKLGLQYVYAGPFVRSSYNAKELLQKILREENELRISQH